MCFFLVFRVDLHLRQYQELEDEFRMALLVEANRFKEVRSSPQLQSGVRVAGCGCGVCVSEGRLCGGVGGCRGVM